LVQHRRSHPAGPVPAPGRRPRVRIELRGQPLRPLAAGAGHQPPDASSSAADRDPAGAAGRRRRAGDLRRWLADRRPGLITAALRAAGPSGIVDKSGRLGAMTGLDASAARTRPAEPGLRVTLPASRGGLAWLVVLLVIGAF